MYPGPVKDVDVRALVCAKETYLLHDEATAVEDEQHSCTQCIIE